ncbi:MAG: hypothetical protein U1E47_06480 [Rivihabitans pingtungensis]
MATLYDNQFFKAVELAVLNPSKPEKPDYYLACKTNHPNTDHHARSPHRPVHTTD